MENTVYIWGAQYSNPGYGIYGPVALEALVPEELLDKIKEEVQKQRQEGRTWQKGVPAFMQK